MNPSINENHPSLEHWVGLDVGKETFDAVYKKGVKVCGKEKTELAQRLNRLPLYDITISPKTVT